MNFRLHKTRRRIPVPALTSRSGFCKRERPRICRRELSLGVLALVVFAGMAQGDETLSTAVQRALAGAPPDIVQRLLNENVILLAGSEPRHGSDPARVQALVLFARPRSRVLQLLLQTARQIEYRPDVEKVETVERFPNGEVDAQEMRIMLVKISYWLRYQWDVPAGRISWGLDPRFPNDLRVTDGFWQLEEVDASHTVGRFGTRVDVGPALPAFLQDMATRKNLPQTLDRCRRWIDSDGRYRP
jgi:hypothetical protein